MSRSDEIFEAALDLAPEERSAFLDRECAADPDLRARVERLLSHAERASEVLSPGGALDALEGTFELRSGEEPDLSGTTIDRYRIVRELGRGGMAVVYLAERADGAFDQKVALKLIQRGIHTEEIARRFAQERQIMAAASHKNLARLLDGGATPDGKPYFVMEYVEGKPIDVWCDERRATVGGRLRLFLGVAEAVAYAHRNLVVHRDVKPANILVTAEGEAKLLDFGIAKLLGDDADDPELTRTGARPMTPLYASPEQLRGEPVTTATDVYQLGLLLYLLLCGRYPYARETPGSRGLERAILEEAPTRPSGVLPTDEIARGRATTPAQLRRRLAGDLDNIVLKAIRKEPERRYDSVSRLVEDVEHYLAGRPVSARPDTLAYRTAKFVNRHRLAVGLAAVSVAALAVLAATMSVQARRIAVERNRARLAAASAERVSEFLVDLFEVSDPGEARGNAVTAREILDRGAKEIRGGLEDEPEVRARLLDTIGRVYQKLGLHDPALPLLEEALATRRGLDPEGSEEVAASLGSLAWLLEAKGSYDAAEPLYREALATRRRLHPGDDLRVASSLNNLGLLLYHKGEYAESEASLREALAMRDRLGAAEGGEQADTLGNLALLFHKKGDLDAAEELYERALAIRRDVVGTDHPSVAIGLDNLGRLHFDRGELDEAERYFREALSIRRRVFGPDHPQVSETLNNLASLLFRRGDLAGAEEVFREVVERDRRLLGTDHPDTAQSLGNLATVLARQGKHAEALLLYREAKGIFEASLPEDHWLRALAHANLGRSLVALGRRDEGERELRTGYAGMRTAFGEDHPRTKSIAETLAALGTQ